MESISPQIDTVVFKLRTMNAWEIVGSVTALLVVYNIMLIIYRLYLSPLAKFPGPKISAATPWYENFIDLLWYNFPDELQKMHDNHGPIVRVTPWELHIEDADFYSSLYVSGAKRRTSIAPRPGLRLDNAMPMTISHELHHQRRKAVDRPFSRQSISRVESVIHSELKTVEDKLLAVKDTNRAVRLDHAFAAVAGDVIGQIACGKSPQLVEGAGFSPEWYNTMRSFLKMFPVFRAFPWLSRMSQMLPVALLQKLNPHTANFKIFALLGENQFERIQREVAEEKKIGTEENTSIFHHLLRSDLVPESEKVPARLSVDAMIFLGGGTITTASILTLITYYIIAEPRIQNRLREEIQTATLKSPDKKLKWADLEKIQYLTSCIKEGLRIQRTFRRIARVSPDQDLQYKKWTIPKNTIVSMSMYSQHMDPEIFPEPNKFVPERWLGSYDPRMDRNLVPFTKGSRNCIGQNLAWAELYIVLGTLFRPGGHKMTLDCDESDIAPSVDNEWGVPKHDSRGLRVLVGSWT